MTVNQIWDWFFNTPGASWSEWLVRMDAVQPLTCQRAADGSFVRDASGSIVVVAAKRKRARARKQTADKLAA